MTAQERYFQLYEELHDLCQEQGWGDPFSYARSREIYISAKLGHTISQTLSGADGYDEVGACEYKSTINHNINGAYNGISVQPTWEEQEKYLREEKIGKYAHHYICRFEGSQIVEAYRLTGEDVLTILLPKLKKKFPTASTKKDPRLGASLTKRDIYQYGVKLI